MSNYGKRLTKSKIEERTTMFVAGLIAMNFNAQQAAIAIGVSPASARTWASLELRKPNVQALIAQRVNGIIQRHDVTADAMVMRLKQIAYGTVGFFVKVDERGQPYVDMTDVTPEQMATLSSIKIKERMLKRTSDDEGNTVTLLERSTEFRMHDAKGAAVDLLKFISGGAKALQDQTVNNFFSLTQNNLNVTVEQKADAYRALLGAAEDEQSEG